jgi:CxxC motif-containing protein (DUF1111 family)
MKPEQGRAVALNYGRLIGRAGILVALLGLVYLLWNMSRSTANDVGLPGGPCRGLTQEQLDKFYATRHIFQKEFSAEEGLGPLFNGRSCFECHGQPGIAGGEGRDLNSTGVVRIGSRKKFDHNNKELAAKTKDNFTSDDVKLLIEHGGPALERKSITSEFVNKYPADCQVEIGTIPPGTDFISLRHAGPLFGLGLIDQIPDETIIQAALRESMQNKSMAGRAVIHVDPLTQVPRVGKFGWKSQNSTLLIFTSEALNVEMGITTPIHPSPKSAQGISEFPPCILPFLPAEPNDSGKVLLPLTYFQSVLAPPERGVMDSRAQHGERLFERLQCAFCHTPQLRTRERVMVVDPDSPAPQIQHMEIKSLENLPVGLYSDLLLHNMGEELADGLPQNGAKGGEWRTTPLWGLRNKKFLLHDGRALSFEQAIMAHGGQGDTARKAYSQLSAVDKADLLSFLKTL